MTTEWRIYCQTESNWVYTWNDTAPTSCANNVGHDVNAQSVQEVRHETPVAYLTLNTPITTTSYQRVLQYHYTPLIGELRRLKIVAYKHGDVSSFDIQCVDTTHLNVIMDFNSTNTDTELLVDCGVFTSPPTDYATIDVNVRQTGGTTSNDFVMINQCIFYNIPI